MPNRRFDVRGTFGLLDLGVNRNLRRGSRHPNPTTNLGGRTRGFEFCAHISNISIYLCDGVRRCFWHRHCEGRYCYRDSRSIDVVYRPRGRCVASGSGSCQPKCRSELASSWNGASGAHLHIYNFHSGNICSDTRRYTVYDCSTIWCFCFQNRIVEPNGRSSESSNRFLNSHSVRSSGAEKQRVDECLLPFFLFVKFKFYLL